MRIPLPYVIEYIITLFLVDFTYGYEIRLSGVAELIGIMGLGLREFRTSEGFYQSCISSARLHANDERSVSTRFRAPKEPQAHHRPDHHRNRHLGVRVLGRIPLLWTRYNFIANGNLSPAHQGGQLLLRLREQHAFQFQPYILTECPERRVHHQRQRGPLRD